MLTSPHRHTCTRTRNSSTKQEGVRSSCLDAQRNSARPAILTNRRPTRSRCNGAQPTKTEPKSNQKTNLIDEDCSVLYVVLITINFWCRLNLTGLISLAKEPLPTISKAQTMCSKAGSSGEFCGDFHSIKFYSISLFILLRWWEERMRKFCWMRQAFQVLNID